MLGSTWTKKPVPLQAMGLLCVHSRLNGSLAVPSPSPPDEKEAASNAASAAAEAKALKQIKFPEMDDDALPSSYIMKVHACLSKWELQVSNMADALDPKKSAHQKCFVKEQV